MEQRLFGDILRNERKRMGLSLTQAAERLRIRPDILQAIENSDIPNMPPRGYARNMVMGYAKFVGLDPSQLAAMYNDEYNRFEARNGRPVADRASRDLDEHPIREPRAARRAREAREGRPPASSLRSSDATQRMDSVQGSYRDPIGATRRMPSVAPYGHDDDVLGGNGSDGRSYSRFDNEYDRNRSFDREDGHYRRTRFDEGYDDQPLEDDEYLDYDEEQGGPLSGVKNAVSDLLARFRGEDAVYAGGQGVNRNVKLGAIAAVLVVVLVIILAFGIGCGKKDDSAKSTDNTASQTTSTETKTETAPTSMKFEYKVEAGTEAWVEVYVDGEQKVAEQVTGEKKESFEVTGEVEFVTASTDGVHVYIDGEEQDLETNDSGLVGMTFSFQDYLDKWNQEHGVKSSSSSNSSSSSSSDSNSSSTSDSSSSASDSASGSTDSGTSSDSTDSGTSSDSSVPAGEQAASYDSTGADNSSYYSDEATGSATTGGY